MMFALSEDFEEGLQAGYPGMSAVAIFLILKLNR